MCLKPQWFFSNMDIFWFSHSSMIVNRIFWGFGLLVRQNK